MKSEVKKQKGRYFGKYESIFDHDVTPEEFRYLTGFADRDEYLRTKITSKYAGYSAIARLYMFRRNMTECNRYDALAEKVPFVFDEDLP